MPRQNKKGGSFNKAMNALRMGGRDDLATSLTPFKQNFLDNTLPTDPAELQALQTAMTDVKTAEATVQTNNQANRFMKRAMMNLMRIYEEKMNGQYN
jgi:glutamate-1-semialdehyde aminotransferase